MKRLAKRQATKLARSGKRRPGSAKREILYVAPDAFKPRTSADLAGDLVGSFRGGPPDASTNKRYLDEAILADYFKGSNRKSRALKLSIDVDESLMRRAKRLTGLRTRREVLQRALETLIRLSEQERIRRYRGKLPSGKRGQAR